MINISHMVRIAIIEALVEVSQLCGEVVEEGAFREHTFLFHDTILMK